MSLRDAARRTSCSRAKFFVARESKGNMAHQVRRRSEYFGWRGAVFVSRIASPFVMAVAVRSICAADALAHRLHEDNLRSERLAAAGVDACGFIGATIAHHLRIELITTHVAAMFGVALLVARQVAFCCAFAITAVLSLLFGLTCGFPPVLSFQPAVPQSLLPLAAAIAALILWRGQRVLAYLAPSA
jgi:preprotein translocase subunit SecF